MDGDLHIRQEALATCLILISALMHAIWNAAVRKSDDTFITVTYIMPYGALLYLPFAPFVPFPTLGM